MAMFLRLSPFVAAARPALRPAGSMPVRAVFRSQSAQSSALFLILRPWAAGRPQEAAALAIGNAADAPLACC